jgi:hypothetical protein
MTEAARSALIVETLITAGGITVCWGAVDCGAVDWDRAALPAAGDNTGSTSAKHIAMRRKRRNTDLAGKIYEWPTTKVFHRFERRSSIPGTRHVYVTFESSAAILHTDQSTPSLLPLHTGAAKRTQVPASLQASLDESIAANTVILIDRAIRKQTRATLRVQPESACTDTAARHDNAR